MDEPGTASFSGALLGGSTLTASVTDPDGIIGSLSYRWQRGDTSSGSFSNITANGTSETYVPVAADVGKYLKVQGVLHRHARLGQDGNQRFEGAGGGQQLRADVQQWHDDHPHVAGEQLGGDERPGVPWTATDGDSDTLDLRA